MLSPADSRRGADLNSPAAMLPYTRQSNLLLCYELQPIFPIFVDSSMFERARSIVGKQLTNYESNFSSYPRYGKRRLRAASAAWTPHIPCTPPPGGVEEEQM